MRVLLIHQAFVSGQEAGGTRHYELGQRLKAYGDQLTVVASQVNYLTGQRIDPSRAGAYYPETIGGIRVLRAYSLPVHHRGFLWRVGAFIVFALSSLWTALRAGPTDLVMGTTPPIFQAFSAWLVAALRRKPLLLEVRDLWPEFAIDMGVLRNPLLIWLARQGERFLYAQADHLLVNSPAYRDYLIKHGVPQNKISFVANGVEVDMFDPASNGSEIRDKYNLRNKFLVVYAGAHGQANDLGTVLRAAERLHHQPDIHFLMVGDGKERQNLVNMAQQMGLTNVTFTGSLPKSDMPAVLAAADACVATLMNIPMFATTYPNKIFDYMAAGRPTILGIDGVIRQVIEAADGGIYVPPGDDAALADAVIRLYTEPGLAHKMGASARRYVKTHFNREQQAEEFRRVLAQLATG